METKNINKVILSTLLAGVIAIGTYAKIQDSKIEKAKEQTMQKMYEPVGNGGALHAAYNTSNGLWITDVNPLFSRLAAVNKDTPHRQKMYQKMQERYDKLGGK